MMNMSFARKAEVPVPKGAASKHWVPKLDKEKITVHYFLFFNRERKCLN